MNYKGVTMNILIAEDAPFLQVFNTELMRICGFDYDMASDGVEAVDYARKNQGKYDLCLMDVEMPRGTRSDQHNSLLLP